MAVFSLYYHMEKGGEGGCWEYFFVRTKHLSPFIKASLSSCWETEILNNITEKELWDWKTKCTTPRSTIMKFVVGRLHTGRKDRAGRLKIQKHWQLHCAPPKWVLEDLKGTKLKVVFDYKVRNMSVLTGAEIFSSPTGVSWPLTSVSEKGTLPVFISDKGKGENRWGTYRAWAHSLWIG